MGESGFDQRGREADTCVLHLIPGSGRTAGEMHRRAGVGAPTPRLWRELKEPIVQTLAESPAATPGLPGVADVMTTADRSCVLRGPGCRDPRADRWLDALCYAAALVGVAVATWAGLA